MLPDVPLDAWKHLELENARLRKELEAARATPDYKAIPVGEAEARKQYEATISKLREFSEGQAMQIRELEKDIAGHRDDWEADRNTIARLTRELEKLKRGKR